MGCGNDTLDECNFKAGIADSYLDRERSAA